MHYRLSGIPASVSVVRYGQSSMYQEKKLINAYIKVVVVVGYPTPSDEGMAEDHGAPEAGQLPRVWTRGRRETESRQK